MRTQNLAIVFTDIQGFTERTSRQTLEENQRLLDVHEGLLAPLFRAFGGRIIKSIGDAFLVTFESPTQAVLCGAAIQDRLWEHNRPAAEADRLNVRVAINVGEVRVDGGDVFGEPVNIAARVESLAEAGEVYFTESVYLSMNKAEVPSEEVGAFELKGIPGKIRVFRVPRAPYRVEAPELARPAPQEGMPPFGNLGLSRVSESVMGMPPFKAALGGPALARAVRASGLHGVPGALRRLPRARLVFMAAVLLGLVVLAALLQRGSAAERAIAAVERAPEAERRARVEEARALIRAEADPQAAAYLSGRLEEAEGAVTSAVFRYRRPAAAGHPPAQKRLVFLLRHPECRVRVAASQAVGELGLGRARGELKRLAEQGGPDEAPGIPIFGCDSRHAARKALERLGDS